MNDQASQGTTSTGSPPSPAAPCSADTIIRNLLWSSDCWWYERNEGHDWRKAVEAAEKYLKACPPNDPSSATVKPGDRKAVCLVCGRGFGKLDARRLARKYER
jgi:hypothetical protein